MKKFLIVILAFICLMFIGCEKGPSDLEKVIELINSCNIVYQGTDNSDNVTKDVLFGHATLGDAKIDIKSDNEKVITNSGKVISPEDDTVVTLTITISLNEETISKQYKLTVKGVDNGKAKAKEISDLEIVVDTLATFKVGFLGTDTEDSVMNDVTFTYTNPYKADLELLIDNENVISKDGKVTRAKEDTLVTVTLKAKMNDVELTKSYKLKVKAYVEVETDMDKVLDVLQALTIQYAEGESKDEVKSNVTFYSKDAEHTTWATNSNALTSEGVVTRGTNDTVVTITATVKINEVSLSKSFEVTVLKKEKSDAYDTVESIRSTSLSVNGSVSNAVIVAVYAKGFLVNDGTGSILVYLNDAPTGYSVGDVVNVSGTTAVFRTSQQFDNTCNITKVGTQTYTNPEPVVLTSTYLDEYVLLDNPEIGKYMKVEGKLIYTTDGYYNVEIDGTTKVVSINYPSNTSELQNHTDENVVITGYVIGRNSTNERMNMMLVSINGDTKEINEDTEVKTIAQILEIGNELASGKTGSTIYYVNGTVKVVESKTQGKFIITNEAGDTLIVYGAKDANDVAFADLTEEIKAGYKVELKGLIQNYYGTIELIEPVILKYEEGTVIEQKGTYSYYFNSEDAYPNGTQYAKETHKLDDVLTIQIEECHLTSELRVYSSSKHNGYVIGGKLPYKLLSLTIGGKLSTSGSDNLLVYGSTDGTNWTQVDSLAFTGTLSSKKVTFDSTTEYTYFKLDVEGTVQLRISEITISIDEK